MRSYRRAMADHAPTFPELGFYALAGQAEQPRALVAEIRKAEALGLGKAFISERWNTKEAATISGALGAVSERIHIATAATNHTTRHPMITGAFAATMHRLTGGRFTLGIGRGVKAQFDAAGLAPITTAQMEDFANVMRRLFAGETIVGHDGPLGRYPVLWLSSTFDEQIPLGLVAFAPNSLALGGRAFDEVVLHTFFTEETLQRCVNTVKSAAEQAGRDPRDVKVWSCLATVGDHLREEAQLRKTVGRLATYLMGYGDLMVKTNRWDPEVLARFRADDVVRSFRRGRVIDSPDTPIEALEHMAELVPDEWLAPAATGSSAQCVARIRREFDLGADGVILHGATPGELEPIVLEYGRRMANDR
jgi:probable F420-dependent oxidoreductase